MTYENKELNELFDRISLVFLLIIVIETCFIGYAYLTADRIECNWIFCNFISERTTIEQRTSCSINGIEINCSEFPADNHFCINGICTLNGVCPGAKSVDNRTVSQCIQDYVNKLKNSEAIKG